MFRDDLNKSCLDEEFVQSGIHRSMFYNAYIIHMEAIISFTIHCIFCGSTIICCCRHGDWVQFRIGTDRRDQLQRATNISLLPDSFNVSGEKREQGVVMSLKEGFGFLRCVEREPSLYFHFNEVVDMDREIALNDEVEFTVVQVKLFR